MILDGHIHIHRGEENKAQFFAELAKAGVGGGLVISESPDCFHPEAAGGGMDSARRRLERLFSYTGGNSDLYPFFWIDPMEADAEEQVDFACQAGVLGFKVICDHYYPYEERPMAVFRAIAGRGKPILFHSGILWDGKFSSLYNRPANFEALITVEGLRFSLAHGSWPWIDECIALYGKFQSAKTDGGPTAEMFIDITPGTPEIYRRELLTKLYTVGYDVENNVIFGTDCLFDTYSSQWANKWIGLDSAIYRELGLSAGAVEKVFGGNLRRFVGVTKETVVQRPLTQMG